MKSSNGTLSNSLGEAMVGETSLGSLGWILDAGGSGDEHEPAHALGRGQRDVQGDAPAQRVAAQHEPLRAAGEHVLDAAGERDRARRVGGVAVPREVERPRQVAFRVQSCRHAIPGAAGAAEPVQQDDALRHTTIL